MKNQNMYCPTGIPPPKNTFHKVLESISGLPSVVSIGPHSGPKTPNTVPKYFPTESQDSQEFLGLIFTNKKETIMTVTKEMINLTSATIVNERHPLHSSDFHRLQRLNEFSKPGGYYELSVGDDGCISWEECDRDYGPPRVPIEVQFRPDSETMLVRVPAHITVTVEKVTKIY